MHIIDWSVSKYHEKVLLYKTGLARSVPWGNSFSLVSQTQTWCYRTELWHLWYLQCSLVPQVREGISNNTEACGESYNVKESVVRKDLFLFWALPPMVNSEAKTCLIYSPFIWNRMLGFAVLSRSDVSDSSRPHGLQLARLLCPWGFSRQEYWSGLPCPPPGDLPGLGIELRSPAL